MHLAIHCNGVHTIYDISYLILLLKFQKNNLGGLVLSAAVVKNSNLNQLNSRHSLIWPWLVA